MLLGYQTAYSQLVFAGKKSTDPCGDVPDAKVNLAKQLHALSANHPGKVRLIQGLRKCCYFNNIQATKFPQFSCCRIFLVLEILGSGKQIAFEIFLTRGGGE